MMYAAPDYAMGAEGEEVYRESKMGVQPGQSEKVASFEQAKRQIRKMRSSLLGWIKFRKMNDEVARGLRKAKLPPHVAAKLLHSERDYRAEQALANKLYHLLSEMFDPASLPRPDIAKDPDAAVRLAKIAIAGQLPGEAPQKPVDLGIVWLWPVLIVGGLVYVLSSTISNLADVAKEKERLKYCRDTNACTDYGFWLKAAGVVVIGWVVWDKMGLKDAKFFKGGRR
jgi:hypothetical protein